MNQLKILLAKIETLCYNTYVRLFNIVFYKELEGKYMAALKTQESKVETKVETKEPIKSLGLTHSTLGTVKKDDGWYVTEVRFNPSSDEVSKPIYTKAGLERGSAIELFKKMAVTLNIVG